MYSGKHAFDVSRQVPISSEVESPSAVEYFLGAVGGDLLSGFRSQAAKRQVEIDGVELTISGRLGNPLIPLGVVGAEGNPGFERITATLYVSSDSDEETIRDVWRSALAVSPLVKTLEGCVTLSLELHVTP